jgi:sphingomyelin phosphodiesterase
MFILARFALIFGLLFACKASIVGDIVNAIEQAVDCDSCRALLEVLKGVAILGDSIFSGALVDVCKLAGVIISCRLSMRY